MPALCLCTKGNITELQDCLLRLAIVLMRCTLCQAFSCDFERLQTLELAHLSPVACRPGSLDHCHTQDLSPNCMAVTLTRGHCKSRPAQCGLGDAGSGLLCKGTFGATAFAYCLFGRALRCFKSYHITITMAGRRDNEETAKPVLKLSRLSDVKR